MTELMSTSFASANRSTAQARRPARALAAPSRSPGSSSPKALYTS